MSPHPRGKTGAGAERDKAPQSLAEATANLGFRIANCRCDILPSVLGSNLSFPIEARKPKPRIRVAERTSRTAGTFSNLHWDVN